MCMCVCMYIYIYIIGIHTVLLKILVHSRDNPAHSPRHSCNRPVTSGTLFYPLNIAEDLREGGEGSEASRGHGDE